MTSPLKGTKRPITIAKEIIANAGYCDESTINAALPKRFYFLTTAQHAKLTAILGPGVDASRTKADAARKDRKARPSRRSRGSSGATQQEKKR